MEEKHLPITLQELKNMLSELVPEDKEKEIFGEVSVDYVLEEGTQPNPFGTYSLDTEKEVQKTILKEIKKRIDSYKDTDSIDYDFTKELGHHQVGIIDSSDCQKRLIDMISASSQPNRKSFSLTKKNKSEVIAYIITITHRDKTDFPPIKVIKKLNLANILSKNKKKASVGLTKGTVRGMPKDIVLMSPESFDLVYTDGTNFVTNEANFHFLFSGTEFLKANIKGKRDKLDDSFEGADNLISFAERNPSVLRGLYHILTKYDKIEIDHGKATNIEAKINQKNGTNVTIFYFSGEKIICSEDNVRYIYWLIAKKYALNMSDETIFRTGSQYPVN